MFLLPRIGLPSQVMAALLTVLVLALPAGAEPRIALIMGNGSYASITSLDNPVPDAELMARTLREQGFEVTMLTDATQIEMTRGIAQFGRDLREAGPETTGLYYYAGHAVQSFGTNYLLPTDADLIDAADLSLVAVQADAVLRQMFSARNKTNIVVLDACRNNPFQSIPGLNDNGLAEMNAPRGTFLAYSTAPGAVALDGLEGNSPFTKALAVHIPTEGLPIEQVFKQVRVDVIAETNGAQTPWDTSSLTSDFVFRPGVQRSAEEVAQEQLWQSVKLTNDPVQVMLFIRGYPGSPYADEARTFLNSLLAAEMAPADSGATAAAPAPKEPTADEDTLIGRAQQSGAAADYQAYLDAFPKGIYAELAAFELAILAEKAAEASGQSQTAALAPEPAPTPAPAPAEEPARATTPVGEITFTQPLTIGTTQIIGRSIAELIDGSPLFPPIEGLPDELWKDQKCSNCHSWTQEALCEQGKTYVEANNTRAVEKSHPYGGSFKQTVKTWASTGCK